ncbi:hypothetical protein L2E82_07017 [Cichorium intybus]|uniref:Uncharacterized protein n=1 Tax=Cichorium intybus TaxID=13427 RepID=A0ACB9G3R5_CICIN|nr:hypothetical protein L2E82_07017 [Cichorium intybus]
MQKTQIDIIRPWVFDFTKTTNIFASKIMLCRQIETVAAVVHYVGQRETVSLVRKFIPASQWNVHACVLYVESDGRVLSRSESWVCERLSDVHHGEVGLRCGGRSWDERRG